MGLKFKLFGLSLIPKKFSDGTYGIQFRSKGIILFYNKVIGIPLGKKTNIADMPLIIKNSDKKFKISFLRGLFDADFTLTFKRKYKDVHYYPVIKCGFSSERLTVSLCKLLKELDFNFSWRISSEHDRRTRKVYKVYEIYISGKKMVNQWFSLIGSHNPKHLTKFKIWKKFGFCPPNTNLKIRTSILNGEIDPLSLENGRGRI